MAEKEERIVCCILENGYGCTYCLSKDGYQYHQCSISNYDCMYDKYGRCSLGITRQEAINRMAKAIKENEGEGPKDLAIVALNELLKDK